MAKLAADQVGPGCDGRERNTPDANLAVGRRIAEPAFAERIGDALVDSGGPERFGIGSGRGIADVVRDAVARDAVVRIDDWHIDRKGQVGVELLNI